MNVSIIDGLKTIIAALFSAWAVPWLMKHGINLTPDQQLQAEGVVFAVIMIACRAVTKTPMFHGVVTILKGVQAANPVEAHTVSAITPEVVNVLTQAFVTELARRQALARKNPTMPAPPAGVPK